MFSRVRPSKNRAKFQQKTDTKFGGLETHSQRDMAAAFFTKKWFFSRFWGPFWGPKLYKKWALKATQRILGLLGALGSSKGPFWVDLERHLGAFGDHFESSGSHFGTIFEVWQQQKKQTEANQAKNNTQWEKLAGNRSQQQHAAANIKKTQQVAANISKGQETAAESSK